MPEGETLAAYAATGATLAIHLSIHVLDKVVAELTPFYGADCPVAVVYRASWPDERVIRGTLGTIAAEVGQAADRAHGADPGRQGPVGARLPQFGALRRRLSAPLPGSRHVSFEHFPPMPDFPAGEVWLAGAGPGDPRLLTLLALHAVRTADEIVHDALIDPRVLALKRDDARADLGRQARRPAVAAAAGHQRHADRARAGRAGACCG